MEKDRSLRDCILRAHTRPLRDRYRLGHQLPAQMVEVEGTIEWE